MELQALGLRAINETDGVIRICDRPEDVLLLSSGVVGDDAGLQLGELVGASPNADENRGLLLLEGVVEDLLDAAPAVLERLSEVEDRSGASATARTNTADPKLLDDVSSLEEIAGPLVGLGAAFEAVYGENRW